MYFSFNVEKDYYVIQWCFHFFVRLAYDGAASAYNKTVHNLIDISFCVDNAKFNYNRE